MKLKMDTERGFDFETGKRHTRNSHGIEHEPFNDPAFAHESARMKAEGKAIDARGGSGAPPVGRTILTGNVRDNHGFRSNFPRYMSHVAEEVKLRQEKTRDGFRAYVPLSEEATKSRAPALTNPRRGQYERNLIQGTPAWLECRKTLIGNLHRRFPHRHCISSSTLVSICGAFRSKSRKKADEEMKRAWMWVGGKSNEPPSLPDSALPAVTHGSLNEINAVATIIRNVLKDPLHFPPNLQFCETGHHRLPEPLNMMGSSPDGIVTDQDGNVIETFEIKCPYCGGNPHADLQMRPYYGLQVHAQMKACHVRRATLVSWGREVSRVYRIEFNDEFLGQGDGMGVAFLGELGRG